MRPRAGRNYLSNACWVLFCATFLAGPAVAGEKPPVIPDQPSSLATPSRVSATIEFGLPAIASAIERDIPRRLATIDERIGCVNRRVLVFRIRANCDVDGFVDRGSDVALWPRRSHCRLGSDLRKHRRPGRQQVHLPHPRRRRGTGHGRGRSPAEAAQGLVGRPEFQRLATTGANRRSCMFSGATSR